MVSQFSSADRTAKYQATMPCHHNWKSLRGERHSSLETVQRRPPLYEGACFLGLCSSGDRCYDYQRDHVHFVARRPRDRSHYHQHKCRYIYVAIRMAVSCPTSASCEDLGSFLGQRVCQRARKLWLDCRFLEVQTHCDASSPIWNR